MADTRDPGLSERKARPISSGMPDGVGPKVSNTVGGGKLYRSRDAAGASDDTLFRAAEKAEKTEDMEALAKTSGSVRAQNWIEQNRRDHGLPADKDDD